VAGRPRLDRFRATTAWQTLPPGKLYILGALAMANVEASIQFLSTGVSIYPLTYIIPLTGLNGAYTYTTTGDCFSGGTATSLGLNNIYHQYYSFTISKGTATYGTTIVTIIPTPVTLVSITAAYGACYHSHLYNWMAQPQVAATTVTGGFGTSTVAYGYAMSGTAVTSCASATVVSTILFKSNIFTGAQYQSSIGSYQAATGTASSTNIIPFYGMVGPALYVAKAATALTWTTITQAGLYTTNS
jgi:hypothetical protein